jgi:hypothetical protein
MSIKKNPRRQSAQPTNITVRMSADRGPGGVVAGPQKPAAPPVANTSSPKDKAK